MAAGPQFQERVILYGHDLHAHTPPLAAWAICTPRLEPRPEVAGEAESGEAAPAGVAKVESSFLGLLHHRTSPTIEMPGMPAGVAALGAASPEGLPAAVEAPEELAAHHPTGLGA